MEYPSLELCRATCQVEPDLSMFYSRVGPWEEKPRLFAQGNGLKLVREAYPGDFIRLRPGAGSFAKFAHRFSQAFAEKTAGTAFVMLPVDDNARLGKAWVRFEKPALVAEGGACNAIVRVNPDTLAQTTFWERYISLQKIPCGKFQSKYV